MRRTMSLIVVTGLLTAFSASPSPGDVNREVLMPDIPEMYITAGDLPVYDGPQSLLGNFDIVVNFVGGLTPSQEAVFSQAEVIWEGVITGYQDPGANLTLDIDAEGAPIDGVGGILGSAGPTFGRLISGSSFFVATHGEMTFDSADLANMETSGVLDEVIMHEMGHVIGFGTLWSASDWTGGSITTAQEVYTSGSGQYTGADGLAAYQSEFSQPGASFVPVELGGGAGTANGHWDEVNGGAGLTSIVDGLSRDMQSELMTGWLNSPTFMSQTTIHSLEDIGYTVIPEPATLVMLVMALLAFAVWTRRGHQPH